MKMRTWWMWVFHDWSNPCYPTAGIQTQTYYGHGVTDSSGCKLRSHGFNTRTLNVGFMVGKVIFGLDSLRTLPDLLCQHYPKNAPYSNFIHLPLTLYRECWYNFDYFRQSMLYYVKWTIRISADTHSTHRDEYVKLKSISRKNIL
jgi:hypothetical protein